MNERFKELRDEAFRLTEWETLDYDAILEKFGELIVQECVEICDKIYFDRYPDAEDFERSEEGDAIKQHFGVE